MNPSRLVLLCCALATANLAAAAGDPRGTSAEESARLTGPIVKVFDDRLSPVTAQVPPLGAVTWVNEGQRAHEVRSDQDAWPTFELRPGDRRSVTFRAAGRFPYKVDRVMEGVVVVAGALRREDGPRPEEQGTDCHQIDRFRRECVFRYRVVVEGSARNHYDVPPRASKEACPSCTRRFLDATLAWRADYPEVDVKVVHFKFEGTQHITVLPVNPRAQGSIEAEITAQVYISWMDRICALTMKAPGLPAYIIFGGYSGSQARASAPDRWHFRSSLTDDGGDKAFSDAQVSAARAHCSRDFNGLPFVVAFPLSTDPDRGFTTADGLHWEHPNLGFLQINIGRRSGPPLAFPLNLLEEGKPFTMSTEKRAWDGDGRGRGPEHFEGIITVNFLRR